MRSRTVRIVDVIQEVYFIDQMFPPKFSPAVKLWLFQFYCTAFCYVQLWAVPLRSSILQRVIHKSVFNFDLFCSASDMFAGINIRSFDAVKRTYLYILCKDCMRLTLVLSILFYVFIQNTQEH